jgi:hypothetical protein
MNFKGFHFNPTKGWGGEGGMIPVQLTIKNYVLKAFIAIRLSGIEFVLSYIEPPPFKK